MENLDFTVRTTKSTTKVRAEDSDDAVDAALKEAGLGISGFISVYQDNPVPKVDSRYGAPMGRSSKRLDFDGKWRAERVPIDEGGYDEGGAYWGLRPGRTSLFAVQDGMGNIAFVDATTSKDALSEAAEI